jgi:hypothetical protein
MSFLLVLASLVTFGTVGEIKLDLKAAKFEPSGNELLGYNDGDEKAFFYINGSLTATAKVADEGEYTITINAACTAALKENAKFTLYVGDKVISKDFLLTTEDQKDYTFTAKFKAGDTPVKIDYTNDVYKDGEYDRNFYVYSVTLKKK